VGPEVIAQAALDFLERHPQVELTCFGAREGLPAGFPFEVLDTASPDLSLDTDLGAGRASVEALRMGVDFCLAGNAQALVTGPVHKPSLHAAGARFPGQTEFLQALTGSEQTGMLMASERTRLGPPLRILLATTHLPLRAVPEALTALRVVDQVALLDQSLRAGWGIPVPRIALCALNPHASDGGLFGDEEARILEPAVHTLRSRGLQVDGPFPADTVFLRALDGRADAIVVPYHDVGMAVFKTLAFGGGVNVTLGLPFPRTSPDHGTAFDLVGRGVADSSSTLAALELAHQMATGARASSPP
jgi:4-hydroxythreonine-4-phosphate dehydrogenase